MTVRRTALRLATVATPAAPQRGTSITLSAPTETNLSGALCTRIEPEVFFPDADEGEAGEQLAKAICAACPVRAACLALAQGRNERFGIFGGLTTAERDALVGRTNGCGTVNGYWRHRRNGSRTCLACREARAAQDRGRTSAADLEVA